MVLLSAPFDGRCPVDGRLPWAAMARVAAGAIGLAVTGLAIERAGEPVGAAIAGGAVHAGLLALGWVLLDGAWPQWRGPALRLGALVMAAAIASRLAPWGAAAYLLVPVGLLLEAARRPDVARIGMVWPRWPAVALGLGAGVFLGVHLLVAASLTLGYAVRVGPLGDYLGALAYDAGLSAVTAEWLFRGAIFSGLWRWWAFAPAAAMSTGLAVARYVLDANLPGAVEVWLGAAFYTGLVGASACALRAWSGSLLPGYLATVVFFAGYRALGH